MQDSSHIISTLIEQNKLLMEMMCAMRSEMTELKEKLTVINKALAYKVKANDEQNWKDALRAKIKANTAIKGSI